jgi:hypothetical protein
MFTVLLNRRVEYQYTSCSDPYNGRTGVVVAVHHVGGLLRLTVAFDDSGKLHTYDAEVFKLLPIQSAPVTPGV